VLGVRIGNTDIGDGLDSGSAKGRVLYIEVPIESFTGVSAIVTIEGGFFKLGESSKSFRLFDTGSLQTLIGTTRGQSQSDWKKCTFGTTDLRNLWYGFVGKVNKVDWKRNE
jgi:hypothetical protein